MSRRCPIEKAGEPAAQSLGHPHIPAGRCLERTGKTRPAIDSVDGVTYYWHSPLLSANVSDVSFLRT